MSSDLPIIDLNHVQQRPATKPLHSNPFFRKELEARLAHQRTLVEESELHQPKVLQRKTSGDGQTFCVYYKKPHNYIGRPSAPIPNYQKMEGQICRTKLPSDYEIDKIVHEKRTTTVTEQKETIHKNKPNHNALQAPPTDPKDLPDPIDRPYVRAADRNQGPPHGQYQANNITTGPLRNPYYPPNAPVPSKPIPYNTLVGKANGQPTDKS